MPRLVNYASRFEFLRRAAFAIVLDRGVGDLSRRAIAAELGTSVSTVRRLLAPDAHLPGLAMDEVTRRRRLGRWGVPKGEPEQVALDLLSRWLPDEPHRIAEELVWWRLVIAAPARAEVTGVAPPEADCADGSLREQFQIADRGWADPADARPTHDSNELQPGVLHRTHAFDQEIDAHDKAMTTLIERAIELLAVPNQERATEAIRVRAMLDGLDLAVCLGRLTPAAAVGALASHIATVRVAA